MWPINIYDGGETVHAACMMWEGSFHLRMKITRGLVSAGLGYSYPYGWCRQRLTGPASRQSSSAETVDSGTCSLSERVRLLCDIALLVPFSTRQSYPSFDNWQSMFTLLL